MATEDAPQPSKPSASGARPAPPAPGATIRAQGAPSDSAGTAPPGAGPARYELLGEVGRGGMGVVYRARDLRLNREIAIKTLHGAAGTQEAALARFVAEAKITGQLQHPGIPAVHELGTFPDGRPFLAMKLVKGRTLLELLADRSDADEHGPLVAVFEQICQAVGYAHAHRVIHRDLKPANVMVGAHSEVQVMDWGLAKVLGEDHSGVPDPLATGRYGTAIETPDNGSGTRTGSILGTPAYMAPEQAGGDTHRVDPRTDVFGLGGILCHILTGEPPYRGSNSKEVCLRAVRGDTRDAFARLDRCRAESELVELCRRCLAHDPDQRPADGTAVAHEVARFRAAAEQRARQAELDRGAALVREAEQRKRRRAIQRAAVVVAAVLVAGIVGTTVGLVRADDARRAERNRAENEAAAKREADAQRQDAETQRRAADDASRAAAEERRVARRRAAVYALETGRVLCEQGDVDRGLHWFARATLDITPADPDLDFEARTNLALWRGRTLTLRASQSHASQLRTLVFDPTGKALLTASLDRTARLWDADTGAPLGEPLPHSHQVEAAALHTDGKTILTGCFDGTLRLWDGTTGKLLAGPIELKSLVREVVLLPDGRTAYARTNDNDLVRVTRLTSREPVVQRLAQKGKFTCLALSPDGAILATGGTDRTVRLWDAATGTTLGEPLTHPAPLVRLAFDPAGTRLAAATDDDIHIWDVKTGQARGAIAHASIRDLAFSPDGRILATASNDRTVRLWDVAARRLRALPLVHRNQVAQVGFTPDGKVLVTAAVDELRLWDAGTGEPLGLPRSAAGMFAIRPDGLALATADLDGIVRLWEVDGGLPPPVSVRHDGRILAAAFHPDGAAIVTADGNGAALLWGPTGKRRGPAMRHTGPVAAVAFDREGRTLATGSWDKTVRLWRAADASPRGDPLEHPGAVLALAFTPNGSTLVTGCNDGDVRLWDVATGARGAVFTHTGSVRGLALSPDGGTVVATGFRPDASVWRLTDRASLPSLRHTDDTPKTPGKLPGGATVLGFNPDGSVCVTAHGSRGYLWNTKTWSQICTLDGHQRGLTAAAFSPDGSLLVTGSWDRTARLWQVPTGKLLAQFSHADAVSCVAFSPDGRMILTGSDDYSARLWSAATFRPLGPPLRHRGEVSVVLFAPDGRAVVTASGTARLTHLTALGAPAGEIPGLVESWTGARLEIDGSLRMLNPGQGSGAPRNTPGASRRTWNLSELRAPHLDDSGPFGRSHLSGH